jgi:hypothetical protein
VRQQEVRVVVDDIGALARPRHIRRSTHTTLIDPDHAAAFRVIGTLLVLPVRPALANFREFRARAAMLVDRLGGRERA